MTVSLPAFLRTSMIGPCTALLLPYGGQAHAQNTACQPLLPEKNKNIALSQTGSYCLQADLEIRDYSEFFIDRRSGRPSEALGITHDDIRVDLQDNAVRIGNASLGIRIENGGKSNYKADYNARQPKQVAIKNGLLSTTSSVGIYSGFYELSILSDMGDPLERASTKGKSKEELRNLSNSFGERKEWIFKNQLALRPSKAADYHERNIRIENMHIDARELNVTSRAHAGAINIQGAGTIIRNCVIETDGSTALWLFGPDAIIEDNTIIVSGASPVREADAPIRLHHGDGAIIRNNRIVIKDGANRRGISLFDTGAITVKKNTFYGMTEKDDVARAFTGSMEMKESGSRFEPAWKAVFAGHK